MEKTAVVWGANGGIGKALVQKISKQDGWQVGAVSRDTEGLEEYTSFLYEADFQYPNSIHAAIMAMSQEIGEIDLWIYAAGDIVSTPVQKIDYETWQRIINANLNGLFLAAHYSMPMFSEDTSLYILGAQTERLKLPGLSAYVSAKLAVEGFCEVLKKELRKPVVIVQPAAVQTSFWDKVPFKIPKNAISAEDLADKIWEAYQEGYQDIHLGL